MSLEFALGLAGFGWRVFPIWGVHENGDGSWACDCGDPDCGNNAGKHPVGSLAPRGFQDSSADPDVIRGWWTAAPNANVGVDCGGSGLAVVDVDPRAGGDTALEEWERSAPEDELLPETYRVETGGGGWHLYYRGDARTRNWLPGVQVKARGGYVVGPGSRHKSGRVYRPAERVVGVAEVPEFLRDAAGRSGPGSGQGPRDRVDPVALLEGVAEGARNEKLFQAAYEMRWVRGLREEETLALVLAAARASTPPYPDEDARNLVARVFEYEDRGGAPGGNLVLFPGAREWAERHGSGERALAGLEPVGGPESGPGAERGSAAAPRYPLTDLGNAGRLVELGRDRLRYVDAWGGWMVWDGCRWVRDPGGLVAQEVAKEVVLQLAEEAHRLRSAGELPKREQQELDRWVQASQGVGHVRASMTLAASDEALRRTPEAFDRDPWLLNTRSGLLDLRTGVLTEPDPAREVTLLAGAPYVEGAAWGTAWCRFVERVMPAEDVRGLLQRLAGYSLAGATGAKVFPILWGAGSNGKSVFLDAVRWALGDYATTALKTVILERRAGEHPTDLAALVGRRFVTVSEVEPGERLSTAVVKALSGDGEVVARHMRQDPFTFRPQAKLWLATNHKPGLREFGEALRSRVRLIPFTEVIPREERRDPEDLQAEFEAEGAGLLAWLLAGLAAWLGDSWMGDTPDTASAKEEWIAEEDVIGQFIEDVLEDVNGAWVTGSTTIYRAHVAWCETEGVRPLAARWLARRLVERGVSKARMTRSGAGSQRRGLRVRIGDSWRFGLPVEEERT